MPPERLLTVKVYVAILIAEIYYYKIIEVLAKHGRFCLNIRNSQVGVESICLTRTMSWMTRSDFHDFL